MQGIRTLLAIALLAVIATAGAGSIKKWVDAQGRVHFGDSPPPAAKSVSVTPEPAYKTGPSKGGKAASADALRPGEQRMLKQMEKEEKDHVEARDRAARESARHARARKLNQAKCEYYRALVRERDQALRQAYSNPQRRAHDQTQRAYYARQAALYCP